MAAVTSSPETLIPKSPIPDTAAAPPPVADSAPPNPNPNTSSAVVAPPPLPQFPPSFRPVAPPHFSPVVAPAFQNPAFPTAATQNPALQPPGVAPGVAFSVPGGAPGTGPVPLTVQPVPPQGSYYASPGQIPRPYWQAPPNGYMAAPPPGQAPGMMVPPPGMPRYPAPYPTMVRSGFPPRPPMPMNVIPTISRPPVPGVVGAPIVSPMVRPVLPLIAPAEKPQTTVYVGKIASTVENSFLLSLLELCGPVKSWKPAQNPSDGSLRGFGFCEFESAEGVLRALRLLSKLKLDGQELVLNVNQATREYLERYVQKKTEREKLKEAETDSVNKENESSTVDNQEIQKEKETVKDADNADGKDKQVEIQKFGIVTEGDKETDREIVEKLKNMIEERLKTKPLPPPPVNIDGSRRGSTEVDGAKDAEDKMDEDSASDNKIASENDKIEGSSADKSRMRDRSRERDRDRDRERDRERVREREKERELEYDLKREEERELKRYERDRERERLKRERDRDMKLREAERQYRERLKEWESREREKEHQRHYEREKEKERESKRHREVIDQEDESDDDDIRKRRRRGGMMEDRRRRRQWEREDDLSDRLKEEEEIAEEKKRAAEEQEQKQKMKDEAMIISVQMVIENGSSDMVDGKKDAKDIVLDNLVQVDIVEPASIGETIQRNGSIDETNTISEGKQNNTMTSRKLGFGLVASGKRLTVPSIFSEEDDDDTEDKKMRPFIPIDYTEESEVPQTSSETPPNLVAAAEFAKRISGSNQKDDKAVLDKDRSKRSTDRHKDRTRYDDNYKHTKEDNKEQVRERNLERDRERDNKKLLDAKQLIDTIPKTKEELFSYEINWAVYDRHQLHERMRPWITKKITDFLGEEETSLVDYIVSSTNSHVKASDMLELLQSILDEEAEMFVLKMWRMLIFEIKKVETGLSVKPKA